MANKTNTTIKGKDGKEYNYYHISRTVPDYDKKLGQFIEKRKSFYGKSKKEAEQKCEDFKKKMEDLKIELSKSTSEKLAERRFGEAVESYITNTFMPDSSIKDATKLRYINSYHNIFDEQDLLSKPLKAVCGEDLQAVFTRSDYAPSSKEAALKLLRNYYKYASSQHIAHDITQGIVIPKAKKKRQDQSIVVYTKDELNAFLEHTPKDHRLRLLIVMAIETGCRIGELLALTYDDIQDDGIRINKSLSELAAIRAEGYSQEKHVEIVDTKSIESVRVMPMTDQIKKELSIHQRWHKREMIRNNYRSDHVFTTQTGELYFPSNTRVALKRLCLRIGVESKGWHAFRHTYGSRYAAAGVPIEQVSKLMGHSDISVTAKYYLNITSDQKLSAVSMVEAYEAALMAQHG